MNQHLNDGQLRAALDREGSSSERHHLEACSLCQARQAVLRDHAQQTSLRLSFLASGTDARTPHEKAALGRFYRRLQTQKETNMFNRLLKSRVLQGSMVVLLLLALIISIPSTRALANQLLDLFRVQQITVVPIDATGMEQLTGNGALGKQLSELISSSISVTQKSGSPVTAADAADASQKAAFTVRLPLGMAPSHLTVLGSSGFNFTIDRAKAQALLDESGRSDLVLPSSIDGEVISVVIPASARAEYGTCPDPSAADSSKGGSFGRQYPDCVMLSELPSPTVSAPADVNVAQLAQIGLEFSGMSHDQAVAFTNSVDWTSTLVVPIPKNAATYQQVPVDSVVGTLIQRPADDAPQFVLLWVKDGIVHAIGGLGTNSQQAIQMANSLH
jgi:hypothetical protein